MIGDVNAAKHIYIVCGYTDMRKSIDGLAGIIQQNCGLDVQEYTDKPVEPIVKTPQGIKRKEPKSGREKLLDKKLIDTEVVNFTLSADKRICPVCGEEMCEMGKEFVREDIQLIPSDGISEQATSAENAKPRTSLSS